MKELPIPAQVRAAKSATELARIWAADGAQHVSLAAGVWPDPAAWGIMLVDLAKHIADAYKASDGRDPQQTLSRIRAALDAEWGHATDHPTGDLLK